MNMFYYDGEDFYLDLKNFMSPDFKAVRDLYIYSNFLGNNSVEKALRSAFCDEFVEFLNVVKRQYSINFFLLNLKKLIKNLDVKYDNKVLVFSKKELKNNEKKLISDHLLVFLDKKVDVIFKIKEDIIGGLIIMHDYTVYDLSVKRIFSKVRKKIMNKILKGILK